MTNLPTMLRAAVLLLLPTLALSSPFVTTWNMSKCQFALFPNISAQTNVTIDWGDGSLTTMEAGNLTRPTHSYATPGFFNVSVFGEFRWKSDISYIAIRTLIDIVSWGDGFLVDGGSSFLFATYPNLRVSADPNTHPVFLPGANLYGMFLGTSFDSPLNWDLGNNNFSSFGNMFANTPLNKPITFTNTHGVRMLAGMFLNASKFNQPFSFDCTSVVSMEDMFRGATAFNSPLNFTNTQKLRITDSMFANATSFNQPVIMDTGSVTSMGSMFEDAVNFNQPVNFNTSQVRSIDAMFLRARSFNQPLSMDTSQVTDMRHMFLAASNFTGPVNFTSLARVTFMRAMFSAAFTQDLSSWDANAAISCDSFCASCALPGFPNCDPCAPSGTRYTNALNQSMCSFSRAPTVPPTTKAPSTAAPSPTVPSPITVAPSSAPSMAVATSSPSMATVALSAAGGGAVVDQLALYCACLLFLLLKNI